MMRLLDEFDQPAHTRLSDIDHWHNHLYNVNTTGSPTYINLFAGCGGLSLGLEKAGFRLALAVEKSPMAAETFYHNFIKRLPPDKAAADAEWAAYCSLSVAEQVERQLPGRRSAISPRPTRAPCHASGARHQSRGRRATVPRLLHGRTTEPRRYPEPTAMAVPPGGRGGPAEGRHH